MSDTVDARRAGGGWSCPATPPSRRGPIRRWTSLITQMYFPGDPLFAYDPILQSVPEAARERLVSRLDMDLTAPEWALGYRWDIVLRGPQATPLEDEEDDP